MSKGQKIIKIGAIVLGFVIISNILSFLFYGLSWFLDISFNNHQVTNFNETYQNIREIEIDGISSSIIIESGDEFKVEATNLENNFTSKAKNGVLKIEEHDKWFFYGNGKGEILITVPDEIVLDSLSIDTGAGKFIIRDIEAMEFDMDHGAGALEIIDSKFSKADIDGGAGMIQIENSNLNNLELDAGVGKVEIEASITGNSQINCGIGEIDVILIGASDDYQIRTEKGIGSVEIAGIKQKNGTVYGNGDNRLDLEGGIGRIKVDFQP